MLRAGPLPSCGATRSSFSPDSSVNHAIDLPSGDHTGVRSLAETDCVKLRSSPFSIGMVTISPRNSNAARAPLGERLALRMYFAPFAKRGRVSLRSAATPIFSRLWPPLRGSNSDRYPPRSKMIFPLPAVAARMGQSENFVSCATCFVAESYEKRLNSPARSDRK